MLYAIFETIGKMGHAHVALSSKFFLIKPPNVWLKFAGKNK